MLQLPGPTIVTTKPETVQTEGLCEIIVTVRFEVAVGERVNVDGVPVYVFDPGFGAVIVCGVRFDIGKVCVTGVAALNEELPDCVATIVQSPAETGVMLVPETVQTPGVRDVRVTVRPEFEVAPEEKAGLVGVLVPGLLNVIS